MTASNGHAPKRFGETRSHTFMCVQRVSGALPLTSRGRFSQWQKLPEKQSGYLFALLAKVIPKSLWLRLVLVSGLPFLLLFLDFSQNVDVLPAGAEQFRALLTTEAHLCGGVGNFVFEYAHIHALHTVGQIPQRHVPRAGAVGGDSLRVNSLHAVFYI